jgi:hypothetical protein
MRPWVQTPVSQKKKKKESCYSSSRETNDRNSLWCENMGTLRTLEQYQNYLIIYLTVQDHISFIAEDLKSIFLLYAIITKLWNDHLKVNSEIIPLTQILKANIANCHELLCGKSTKATRKISSNSGRGRRSSWDPGAGGLSFFCMA